MTKPSALFISWLFLIAATLIASFISQLPDFTWLIILPLGLTAIKGQLVVDVFMGMNKAPLLWRGILTSYVWLLLLALTSIYLW